MLLRRALPAARQSLAHSFPISEMGSKPIELAAIRFVTIRVIRVSKIRLS